MLAEAGREAAGSVRDLEALGFFACSLDLEDELIRAAGPTSSRACSPTTATSSASARSSASPPSAAVRSSAQLRRFAGTASGRKTWFAADVVEVLPLDRVPARCGACSSALGGLTGAPHALGLSPRAPRCGWVRVMSGSDSAPGTPFNFRLAILLAMAMFVLVVDTSLMNVSISAVVQDLDTTVSGVQGAIALEALVSAAFILIGGKTGDLIGRKLAYILGLLGYAVGAIAMVFAQDLAAIIVFWAIIGGIGASLLLPAMQSLIHGNFEGAQQKRVYALVGASAAIAAAVGPLLGGFITTFLSWRVGFALEAVIIAVVLAGIGLVKDVPYHGDRSIDLVGALLSIVGMGGVVTGILVWQEGGGYVGLIIGIGVLGLGLLVFWLRSRKRRGKPTLLDPTLFESKMFRAGASGQLLQQIALGGTMIVLPIYLQMVFEYNALQAGLSIAPLSLSMFVVALLAGRGLKRRPANIILWGFVLAVAGLAIIVPIVPIADSGWYLTIPLIISGCGLGPARLAAEQLHPLADLRRAGQRGGGRELGRGLVRPLVRPRVRRARSCSRPSRTRSPRAPRPAPCSRPRRQQQVSSVLEEDAEIMTNTGLEELLVDQPPEVQEEILRHQHRLPVHRAPGGPVRADPRGPPRHPERAADAAAARSEGVAGGRGHDARLASACAISPAKAGRADVRQHVRSPGRATGVMPFARIRRAAVGARDRSVGRARTPIRRGPATTSPPRRARRRPARPSARGRCSACPRRRRCLLHPPCGWRARRRPAVRRAARVRRSVTFW